MKKSQYKFKIALLVNKDINYDFVLKELIPQKTFTESKTIIGTNIFTTDWFTYDAKSELKFVFFDFNTKIKYDQIKNKILYGANGSIILYDLTNPDTITFLAKWILDLIITCKNLPILLLGITPDKKINEMKKQIELFIEDRKKNWRLSIKNIYCNEQDFDSNQVINFLSKEIMIRGKKPKLKEFQKETIQSLKKYLINETNISRITHVLTILHKNDKTVTSNIVKSLASDYFIRLFHKQEKLIGFATLIDAISNIEISYKKEILAGISIEKLLELIEKEKELKEIILLLNKYQECDSTLWDNLQQSIPLDLMMTITAKAWVSATIEASWSHSTIMELIQTISQDDSLTNEMIRYLSRYDQQRRRKETLRHISSLFALILTSDIGKVNALIEMMPTKAKEIALEILDEEKDLASEQEPMRMSLEIGELSRINAAKDEIKQGLSELFLLVTCLENLPRDSKIKLLNSFSYKKLNDFMLKQSNLSASKRLLKQLLLLNKNLASKLLTNNLDYYERLTLNESSIFVINNFLEVLDEIDSNKTVEIIGKFPIETLVKKMILFYAELDIEQLNIPLLMRFITSYGIYQKTIVNNVFQFLFPEIPEKKLSLLYQMLSELIEIVEEGFERDELESRTKLLEIYDFFINFRLLEINKLLQLILKSLLISVTEIKEAFQKELLFEERDNFSYEKNKLHDFVSNFEKEF